MSKYYILAVNYNTFPQNEWVIVIPTYDTRGTNGNDITLDANWAGAYGPLYLRIRLSEYNAATPPANTFFIILEIEGDSSVTFVPTSATGTASAPTNYLSGSNLVTIRKNTGIGTWRPLARLHAGMTISDYGALSFANTGALISSVDVDQDDQRTNVLTLIRDGTNAVVYAGAVRFDLSRWEASATNARTQLDIALSHTSTDDLMDVLTLRSDGNVGISSSTPSNILTVVQNSATDPIADSWTAYSSIRWKKDIKPIECALEKVKKLRGVEFKWKATGKKDIGMIAEEVGEIFPEVVAYEKNSKYAKSLDYARLVAVLVEAIKEQQKEIEDLKLKVNNLEGKLSASIH
jgi:hypothetical protein